MAMGTRKLVQDVSALGQVRLWAKRAPRPEEAKQSGDVDETRRTDSARRTGEVGIERQNPTEARSHADAGVLEAKLARIDEPHVKPLNDLVREINADGEVRGVAPWFDPDGGGVDARVLLLFESPGTSSIGGGGSGIVSADNDDPASATFFALREEAGLPREKVVAWNAVPWPLLSSTGKPRPTVAADLAEAEPWLSRLVALLPHLRLVVTFGTSARDGWLRLLTNHDGTPLVPTLAVSQTSPNAVRVGDSRARILLALRRAVEVSA